MSMREKAALAAQRQRLEDFRSIGLPDPPDEENGPMPMDYRQVDAILDAMREPSEEMIKDIAHTGEEYQTGTFSAVKGYVAGIDAIKAGK